MATTQIFEQTLVLINCGGCGVTFGMEESFLERRKADHKNWYCPNGCIRHYTGQSDKERLEQEIKNLTNSNIRLNNYITEKNQRIEQLNYSVRAQKAAKTKILNRVKNGVCPCCNRTFQNLQNHFKTQHPELLEV